LILAGHLHSNAQAKTATGIMNRSWHLLWADRSFGTTEMPIAPLVARLLFLQNNDRCSSIHHILKSEVS
jgi:hypothetical protein